MKVRAEPRLHLPLPPRHHYQCIHRWAPSIGPCWEPEIDLFLVLLWAVLAIILVWSYWETAWSQNKNLHLHQCPIKTSWNFAVGWNARSCLVRLQQHCLLVPATGNHTMFQHFLANRCLFCFLAYSDYADVIQLKCKLTRPAIGVDSLFTLLIIPGFNWLIRLRVKTISKQITKYSSHKR